MRILFCHRPDGAFGYITDGMINALIDRGHIVQRWNGLESSWINFAPDIYCGASGHKQPIPPRRTCKVAIHTNPFGPVKIDGINESDETITWVTNQRPDAVFGYGQETDRILWSYWTQKKNFIWVPMPTAGDKTLFKKLSEDDNRQYDIVYVGGRWSYKGITIDEYLVPLLSRNDISFKLHGWGDWPANLCSGRISDDQIVNFFNSGRVGPCIAEKHTHSHGIDIPERAFKVALCGALIVHDAVPALRAMIPSAVIATNADQFREYCRYFSRPENAAERLKLAEAQRQEVLAAHTYHHRIATLFQALGFDDAAQSMLN